MNRDMLKGEWMQLKGKIKKQWGKLTDDDLTEIEGNRDILVGKLQERYGRTREDIERELDAHMQTWAAPADPLPRKSRRAA